MEGIRIPRKLVQMFLKEIDPAGCERRRQHSIRRSQYVHPGPDCYDKLKPSGFPIHGAIDGYSRKILWLKVARTSNSPDMIGSFYSQTVGRLGGCPVKLITDLGTENRLAASIQCFFRNNSEAHQYVASPRNQRIEGWWSQFAKQRANWWWNFFKDLVSRNIFDSTDAFQVEALWFSFSGLVQEELNFVMEHWNTNSTRKNRFGTVSGRPDALYYPSESFGGTPNLMQNVPDQELQYSWENLLIHEEENVYFEYYVCHE